MNKLKHEPKVYVLSLIFGILIFATIDKITPWIGAASIVDVVIAIGKSVYNAFAYVVAIGFFSGVCIICVVALIIIGGTFSRYA